MGARSWSSFRQQKLITEWNTQLVLGTKQYNIHISFKLYWWATNVCRIKSRSCIRVRRMTHVPSGTWRITHSHYHRLVNRHYLIACSFPRRSTAVRPKKFCCHLNKSISDAVLWPNSRTKRNVPTMRWRVDGGDAEICGDTVVVSCGSIHFIGGINTGMRNTWVHMTVNPCITMAEA